MAMATTNARARIGGNRPPDEMASIKANLAERNAGLLKRSRDAVTRAKRLPVKIADDAVVIEYTTFVDGLTELVAEADKAHDADKKPYLTGGRAVDSWFRETLVAPLDDLKRALKTRLTTYLIQKEEDAREEARKKQAEAAAEAAKLAKAARKRGATDEDQFAAAAATVAVEELAEIAEANPADLARVRDADGAVAATLKTEWSCTSFKLEEVDLEALRPFLAESAILTALNKAVRAGVHVVRGAVIEEVRSAML